MNEVVFAEQNKALLENLAEVSRRKDRLEQQEKEIKARLLPLMEEHGVEFIDNEIIRITYVRGSETVGIDTNALRAEDPELYNDILNKFNKRTKRSAHVRFKAK